MNEKSRSPAYLSVICQGGGSKRTDRVSRYITDQFKEHYVDIPNLVQYYTFYPVSELPKSVSMALASLQMPPSHADLTEPEIKDIIVSIYLELNGHSYKVQRAGVDAVFRPESNEVGVVYTPVDRQPGCCASRVAGLLYRQWAERAAYAAARSAFHGEEQHRAFTHEVHPGTPAELAKAFENDFNRLDVSRNLWYLTELDVVELFNYASRVRALQSALPAGDMLIGGRS